MTHQREAVERNAARNTDRELWREEPGDYYSPSIHVTAQGAIGINVGGSVIVQSVRQWHNLAKQTSEEPTEALRDALNGAEAAIQAAFGQAEAEYQGHDTRAGKYDKIIRDWRERRDEALAMRSQQSGNSHE